MFKKIYLRPTFHRLSYSYESVKKFQFQKQKKKMKINTYELEHGAEGFVDLQVYEQSASAK
jgi:hypothetical protein